MTVKYDIGLSDGKANRKYTLTLDGDGGIQETTISEDNFAAYIRNVGKKFGDFDEQRNWKGGRGSEYFNNNPDGFFDSMNCWTMSTGSLMPTLQMKFARDFRSQDFVMPGDVAWKALLGTDKYLDVLFTASASYSAAHVWMWIRRVGNPGTLTVELCSDSAGSPDSVLKTMTVTTATITDIISVLHDFIPASVQALVSGTSYHVKIYAGADSVSSHWEVGTGVASGLQSGAGASWTATTYAPYYRVTDADVNRVWYGFMYDDLMYFVDKKDSGSASVLWVNGDRGKATAGSTSTTLVDSGAAWSTNKWAGAQVKIKRGTGKGQNRTVTSNTGTTLTVPTWDITPDNTSIYIIYATDRFTQITSTGLGKVMSCPFVSNDIVYFPQGSTNVRRMTYTDSTSAYSFADDSTNKWDYMCGGDDATDGPQVWGAKDNRANRANQEDWPADLDFTAHNGTSLVMGSSHYGINGMLNHGGLIYVFKGDSVWNIAADKPKEESFGIKATPNDRNGQASCSHNLYLYFNWLWSTERLYSGTLDDIGQDWSGVGLPDGRQGFVTKYEPAVGWLFVAVDADSGTSSVLCYDGMSWHEVLRGFAAGRKIQNVNWQPCDGTRHRLWTSIGGELVYQEMPLNTANPLNDASVNYQHEAVLTSSTIDMGAASRLPKYIKALTVISKNLSSSGKSVELDYQTDEQIDTGTWTHAAGFLESPEQEIKLNIPNVRQFRYRLRLITNDASVPPVVKCVVPSGFARVPFRRVWHLRIKTGEIYDSTGKKAVPADKLKKWLRESARYPGIIHMTSKFKDIDDVYVIISPPSIFPKSVEKDTMTFSLMEV